MDAQFWHDRWAENQIGFHEGKPNTFLVDYFNRLELSKNARVLLPLCGKSIDSHWLLSQGYHVIGAELSELAIKQLFEELKLKPTVTELENHKHYSADNIDIFVGDFFDLTSKECGVINAVYDRAALIALPEPMRKQYTQHLQILSNKAKQLLIVLDYDQSIMNGPPFSISDNEVKQHYRDTYTLKLLDTDKSENGLKGQYPVEEKVWLLN